MLRDIADFTKVFLWLSMPIVIPLILVYLWVTFVNDPNSRARCAAHHATWAPSQDTGDLTACESVDEGHVLFWVQPTTGLILVQRDNSPFCIDQE